ncbi:NADase-type glycan-binding domain-containing protein [Haliangium ochraceum]|uniref:NAD glycohydrolase translocation F5/8 type C domain-containing protein n=1 Tax=Haliangium ochraceum (strain DSM 14365 / JCM 11303 / SMP-2) TaxID=502025 RepID=D0LJD8_HALO1|nr:hypothetical protein [Haliangium ochraceum]ACY14985.1 hypothetical protein Hoch_2449 [Haliangium ochraceum DSM 14365]
MRRLTLLSSLVLCCIPALAAGEAEVERRLHPLPIEASSFLWTEGNRFQANYHPFYAVDDDPKTAWVEGADSSGAGEWLRLHLSATDATTRARLAIRAGYQKSRALFAANARPRELSVKLLPSGVVAQVTLEDRLGWQELSVEQPGGRLEAIELRVDSVYPGTRHQDLSISDIRVFATSSDYEQPELEKLHFEHIQRWKAARTKMRARFAGAQSGPLPLLPSYRLDTQRAGQGGENHWHMSCEGVDYQRCMLAESATLARMHNLLGDDVAPALQVAEQLMREVDSLRPVRLAFRDKRPIPTADNVHVPPFSSNDFFGYGFGGFELPYIGTMGVFFSQQIGLRTRAAAPAFAPMLRAEHEACNSKREQLAAWALEEPDGSGQQRLRGLLLVRCGLVESRIGPRPVAQAQVLVYDDAGRLSLILGPGYANALSWSQQGPHAFITGGRGVTYSGDLRTLRVPEYAQRLLPGA